MVPPGTALSASARRVAAVALGTLFSSERTGWAPPGPGGLAWLLPKDDAILLPVPGLVVAADALSVLARTPPPIMPAASRPAAPSHFFLRLPVVIESCIA